MKRRLTIIIEGPAEELTGFETGKNRCSSALSNIAYGINDGQCESKIISVVVEDEKLQPSIEYEREVLQPFDEVARNQNNTEKTVRILEANRPVWTEKTVGGKSPELTFGDDYNLNSSDGVLK